MRSNWDKLNTPPEAGGWQVSLWKRQTDNALRIRLAIAKPKMVEAENGELCACYDFSLISLMGLIRDLGQATLEAEKREGIEALLK